MNDSVTTPTQPGRECHCEGRSPVAIPLWILETFGDCHVGRCPPRNDRMFVGTPNHETNRVTLNGVTITENPSLSVDCRERKGPLPKPGTAFLLNGKFQF